ARSDLPCVYARSLLARHAPGDRLHDALRRASMGAALPLDPAGQRLDHADESDRRGPRLRHVRLDEYRATPRILRLDDGLANGLRDRVRPDRPAALAEGPPQCRSRAYGGVARGTSPWPTIAAPTRVR